MKGCGLDSNGSAKGHVTDSCQCVNEISGSIKGELLIHQNSNYQIFMQDFYQ